MNHGPAITLCLAIGLVTHAAAQPKPTDFEERDRVIRRLVDVSVTDRKGNPVTGLTPEDFAVTVEGSERRVFSVDASSRPAAEPSPDPSAPEAAAAARPAASAAPRWIMICLDADRIPRVYRKVVLETARSIVARGGGTSDRFAVALLRNGSVELLHDFAPAAELNFELLQDPGMLLTHGDDLRFRLDALNELIASCRGQANPGSCALTLSEEFLFLTRQENATGVRALRGLVASLAPLPGRKALIWLSNGMVPQPGDVVIETVSRHLGETRMIESRLGDRDTGFEFLLAEATRARVTFFSLKAGHDISQNLRGADKANVNREVAGFAGNAYRLANSQAGQTLRDAALATGGKAIFTPLGEKVGIGLLEHLDGVYTLALEVRTGDSQRSRVKVKLPNRKARIQVQRRLPRHVDRKTYELAAVVSQEASRPGEALLTLTLDLGNVATEPDDVTGLEHSRLALYARIRDPEDPSTLDDRYRILALPRDDTPSPRLVHPIHFRLPPGGYVAEVFVSDLVGGGQSSASVDVVVAPYTDHDPH